MPGASGSERTWHVANDDGSTFEENEAWLARGIAQGAITRQTLVWRPGMAEWQPAGRMLSSYFVQAPPARSPVAATNSRGGRGVEVADGMDRIQWRRLFFSFKGRINRAKFWIGHLLTLLWVMLLSLFYWVASDYLLARGPRNVAPGMEFQEQLGTWLAIGALVVGMGLLWLVPILALAVKRLHDRNKRGWWLLVFYVLPSILGSLAKQSPSPLAPALDLAGAALGIWGFVEIGCLPGTRGANRFGRDPLAGG